MFNSNNCCLSQHPRATIWEHTRHWKVLDYRDLDTYQTAHAHHLIQFFSAELEVIHHSEKLKKSALGVWGCLITRWSISNILKLVRLAFFNILAQKLGNCGCKPSPRWQDMSGPCVIRLWRAGYWASRWRTTPSSACALPNVSHLYRCSLGWIGVFAPALPAMRSSRFPTFACSHCDVSTPHVCPPPPPQYTHLHMHAHTHARARTHACKRTHTRTHAHAHAHTHTHTQWKH